MSSMRLEGTEPADLDVPLDSGRRQPHFGQVHHHGIADHYLSALRCDVQRRYGAAMGTTRNVSSRELRVRGQATSRRSASPATWRRKVGRT
jgi:hypothetical protein